MTGPLGSLPPLAEPCHRHVVQRHVRIDAKHPPARPPESDAKLGLLAGNQRRVEPTELAKRLDSHHRIAPASFGLTYWRVPVKVSQMVVD
jgi:hypothetical protein